MKKKREHAAEPPEMEPEAQADGDPNLERETSEPAPAGNGEAVAEDYKDRWLRSEADLQNYRRRARREIEEARRTGEEAVLLDLIRWLDDLERALEAARAAGAAKTWTEGIGLVMQKGRDALARHGVQLVDPIGEPFDPQFHEAILETDQAGDVAPGSVAQVVLKGYRRGDRAVRPARVVVARAGHEES
jgi:molecular chaperone GrpE